MKNLQWYLDVIKHEIEMIENKEFIGSIDFKINIRQGTIGNMNINLTKSIKTLEDI
jgi:hypothetical protein